MARAKGSPAADSRRAPLLDAAARLFAEKGYDATSTRDIARSVGMLSGSLYYHFRSKEDLLLAVYREGVSRFTVALDTALTQAPEDAWQKLELACTTHMNVLLASGPFAQIIGPEFIRSFPPQIQCELIAERDEYEQIFEKLIAELPLRKGVDPWLFKAALFGSLNWTLAWYHQGRHDIAAIAKSFVGFFEGVVDPHQD